MRTLALDTEYDYMSPFLATTTDEEMVSRVYRVKVLSQRKLLKEICERRDIRKVFHHATGDIFQLRNIGIRVADPVECTLIASNIVDENYKSRNLKKLAEGHLGIVTSEANRLKSTIKKYKEKAKKGGYTFKWSQIPEEVMIPYARRDPEYTLKLWYYWQIPIEESRQLYEFEKSLIPTIVEMQWKGLRIDRYLCRRLGYQYGQKLEALYDEMSKYLVDHHIDLGKDFNPRSVPQIQQIILQMGEEHERDGMTWSPKTDKKALQALALNSKFFIMLMKSRFYTKHKGTYYDPLYDYYTSDTQDRAHLMMYQTGAKTGRFSVELGQTFAKPEMNMLVGEMHRVRECIIPSRGKAFLCMDYEQQEARLFCHYANCERMIDIINAKSGQKGFDIYIETGELLFGRLFDKKEYRKLLRFIAKTDFLAGIYGEGKRKLITSTMQMLYEKFDKKMVEEIGIDEQWAYETLTRFYEMYPVREYMQSKIAELYREGSITMSFDSPLMQFTRQYRIPREFAYKAPNVEIQGCLYGGARVYTKEHGYTTLKEIVDKVVTVWDGERFVKAQCLYSGKKKKVEVVFKNGQMIVCSPEHKFLRINANVEWCEAKDLKEHCRVIIGNAIPEQRYDVRGELQHDFNKYCETGRTSWNRSDIDFSKIKDFDFGVLLGRLVSDGCISRDCVWLIADHEHGIFEYLKSNLELMGKIWAPDKDLRKDRNEIVHTLTLGSSRLGELFKHLKTEVPNWLFRNTEILRGYLRGLFDGDGGVNDQGIIMLTQGGKTLWLYMRRVQEALLLFGVKSRLHFYEYPRKGYETAYRCFHLQIFKKDNGIFAERIGFINEEKQSKIKYVKEDYGDYVHRTETVKFVNIKDEEIDMYDIVNSESGRYMANGLVTHNTAAYIIKHAMQRIPGRILLEGWSGRVEMILQVHDELIFEVDNDEAFIKEVYQSMKYEMEDRVTFKVPITVSGKWSSRNLAEVKELEGV